MSEDAISRQDILDVLEMDQYCDDYCAEHDIEPSISIELFRTRLHDLPPVRLIPCEDAVSRQAAQEAITMSIELKENPHQIWKRIQGLPSVQPIRPCLYVINRKTSEEAYKNLNSPIYPLDDMPSIQPIRPQGNWILDETDNSITCDKCGCLIWANDISNGEAHYCPNCGADMKEDTHDHT